MGMGMGMENFCGVCIFMLDMGIFFLTWDFLLDMEKFFYVIHGKIFVGVRHGTFGIGFFVGDGILA